MIRIEDKKRHEILREVCVVQRSRPCGSAMSKRARGECVEEWEGAGPGPAERKRELERNRRNLVHVRFAELEAELGRGGDEGKGRGKRIDKEAVLKEAAQTLAARRKESALMADRLRAMTAEIDNLRAEKVELRADKAYLRAELETVRGDVQRLRSDNINLWQVLQKKGYIKNSLAPDVAKLPAQLFSREPTAPLPNPPPHPPPQPAPEAHEPGRTPQHHAPQELHPQPQQQERNTFSDAFLVSLSGEELGDLFANYTPTAAALPSEQSAPDNAHQSLGNHQETAVGAPSPHLYHSSGAEAAPQGVPRAQHEPQNPQYHSAQHGSRSPPASNVASQQRADEDDLLSDVAYCV